MPPTSSLMTLLRIVLKLQNLVDKPGVTIRVRLRTPLRKNHRGEKIAAGMVPGMGVCLVLRVILRTHARITSHCCTTKLCSPKTLHNKRCTGQIRARGGLTDRVCTSVPALGSCTTTIFPPVVGAAANCRNLDHTHRGWRCTEVSERQDNACQDRYIHGRLF